MTVGKQRESNAAGSAAAAEELLRTVAPFELLVTEMVMPCVGGAELARRACATCPDIRVLFISEYTQDTSIRHLHLERGKAFLAKPFTSEEILTQVHQPLDNVTTPDVAPR